MSVTLNLTNNGKTVSLNLHNGRKGDKFTYEDFTPEQLALLKGDKGEGFTYEDFTEEQLEALMTPFEDTIINSQSIFVKNAFFKNSEAVTRNIKKSVKKISLEKWIGERLSLRLLYHDTANNTILSNIQWYNEDAGAWGNVTYSGLPVQAGVSVYTWTSSVFGRVELTLDTEQITSQSSDIQLNGLGGATHEQNEIQEIHKLNMYPEEKEYLFNSIRDVFVPNADIKYAGKDLNESYRSAIKSISASGDYGWLRLFLSVLTWNSTTKKLNIKIGADYPENTSYNKILFDALEVTVEDPEKEVEVVINKDRNQLNQKHRDVEIRIVIKPSLILGGFYALDAGTFEKFGFRNIQPIARYDSWKHKTLQDMLRAGSMEPIQYVNDLPYKLITPTLNSSHYHDKRNFTPMWNAWKSKAEPKVSHLTVTPPSVIGHNNNHAILSDIGPDDTMYFYGSSDKNGRVYKSTDYGETLIELFDIPANFPMVDKGFAWSLKILPNNELLFTMSCTIQNNAVGLDEKRTYSYVSSNNQTEWEQSTFEDLTPFHLNYYKETDAEGNITFQDWSRLIDSWGFDCYKNYVVLTQYGETEGTPNPALGHTAVGYMSSRSIFLSEDYGKTFREIFDYLNMPAGCTPLENLIGGHHCHGVFIDHYHTTNGVPRIVGLIGDQENRMVITDDLGSSWFDNKLSRLGYGQSVSGKAVAQGWLLGTDAVGVQGIQLAHRGNKNIYCSEIHRTLSASDEILAGNGLIVHVGINFYQRDFDYPILTGVTPEASGQYSSGTRGEILASFDGGLTFQTIYTDDKGYFKGITGARVFQDRKRQIWVSPALWTLDLGDGYQGRVIKIVL